MPISMSKSGVFASVRNKPKRVDSAPSVPIDVKLGWNESPSKLSVKSEVPAKASLKVSTVTSPPQGLENSMTTESFGVDSHGVDRVTKKFGKHSARSSLSAVDELKLSEKQITSQLNPLEQREQALNKVMGIIIVSNAFMMAAELDYGPQGPNPPLQDRLFWFTCESLFILVFVIELLIRVYWERTKWVRSWWNWLDFIVVAVAVTETWILTVVAKGDAGLHMLTLLRVIRLVRLVRVVKLMRMFRSLYVTVMAMKHAFASMVNIAALMLAGIFLSAIFTTATIGHNEDLQKLQMGIATGEERFGSIPDSMYSLFELMTLEGWDSMGRPLVKAEPAFALFLFSFIMVFTFGLLNMVVAMVVEKTIEQTRMMDEVGKQESKEEFVARLKAVFLESDLDRSGTITADELGAALVENSKAREYLESVGIRTESTQVLFAALDGDDSGEVTLEELLQGCARIRGTGSTEWDILAVQAAVRTVQNQIHTLTMLVQDIHDRPGDDASQCDSAFVSHHSSLSCLGIPANQIASVESDSIMAEREASEVRLTSNAPTEILACSEKDPRTIRCTGPGGYPFTEFGENGELILRLEACLSMCTKKHEDLLASVSVQVQRLLGKALEDNAVKTLSTETITQSESLRRLETEIQARTAAFEEWRRQLPVGLRHAAVDCGDHLASQAMGLGIPSRARP